MSPSSLFGHTIEVFSEFREKPEIPADAVLRHFFLERKYLGARDRRVIAETFFGVIKQWRRLEAAVADAFEDEAITGARMIAAYALMFQAQQPEEVSAAFLRYTSELPMEGLRRIADPQREASRLSHYDRTERLAIFYSFPTWFVRQVETEYGTEHLEAMLSSLNGEAPTSVRTNILRTTREELQLELAHGGCEAVFSNIAENALVLTKRVNIAGLEPFKLGYFEVQDEASQLIAPFAHIRKTAIKVLDACAGAGGKTLHLSTLMKNHGEIFATDVDPRKLEALKERARRSGAQNVRIVMPEQKERFLGADKSAWFDLVLLDVPCSGTGTLRRNPGIKLLLTPAMLAELIEKQRQILEENHHFLKPGGTLLYATCSILKEEGEDQMAAFVESHPEFTIEETLRTRPDTGGCDGFFAARLKKASNSCLQETSPARKFL